MRIVFDLDDTISRHTNRDYPNAEPMQAVISRMRELRDKMPDCTIVINTARGMNSCKGDTKLAEERNRPTVEAWLAKHGVPYDEIVFGKPLGDAYVDDKSISVEEFEACGVSVLRGGFSGASVCRLGRIVVKECPDAPQVTEWYRKAEKLPFLGTVTFPRLLSNQLGKLYLRYQDGRTFDSMTNDELAGGGWVTRAALALRAFAGIAEDGEPNDVALYCEYLKEKGTEVGVETDILCAEVMKYERILSRRTFCHGDFSTMNLLVTRGCEMCAIDPHWEKYVRSYLTDGAKFLACLYGLEAVLTGNGSDRASLVGKFLSCFTPEESCAMLAMERTMVLRVMPYALKNRRLSVLSALGRMV